MPSKSLPKPVSERTLQKKYIELANVTHGRIDITTDPGRCISSLLHRYFAAFSNLYGVILLQNAWELFCEAEPELVKQKKLLKKDFLAFSDVLRIEALPYYILNWNELDPDASEGNPADRLLVNKKLIRHGYYRFRDLAVLMESQADKPYALLKKEEYRAWAAPDCFRKSSYAQDMLHFLENLRVATDSKNCDVNGCPIHGKNLKKFVFWNRDEHFSYNHASRKWEKEALAAENNIVESEKLMRKIERQIQLADPILSFSEFLNFLMSDLQEVGVQLTESQFEKLVQLYTDLNNKSHLWCNCGWTPDALFQMEQPKYPLSISFGPGLQAAFANGDIDQTEVEHLFREKGFHIPG